ncbi:universal stress protein [Oceanobacillus sp. CF4.6]|uniref:universal stress protein n=1 Tax=Oceanobacillus sp. CF4.6 TaxID=3373080 RepID=UPI003EE6428D
MTKKVLVAYDGSILSRKALEEAKVQASQLPDTEVHIISVVKPTGPNTNAGISRSIGYELAEDFRPQMEKIKQEFEKLEIPVETNIIIGETKKNPGGKVCEYATEHAIDMIILGSRGLGNLKKIFLGSVSNEIVQNATCPVLVIK